LRRVRRRGSRKRAEFSSLLQILQFRFSIGGTTLGAVSPEPAPPAPHAATAAPVSRGGLARVFAVSWLAYASYYLGRKGFSVAKASVARELGLSPANLAVIDTAFLVAYAAGQVPSGLAADRLGARRLVAGGLLASAIACALFGWVGGAALLGLCFAVNGLAQSTGWPGTTRLMADVTAPGERGRVMGAWSTCYQVGGIAATALAAFLLEHHGWRAAFHGPALWLAAMGVAVLVLLPRSPAGASQAAAALSTPDARGGRLAARVLANPVLLSYGACYFCLKLIRYSLLFWLPYYLHTEAGFGEAQSGYLSTSFEIGGVAGSVGLGYASDRSTRGRAAVALLSILGLAVALLLYARLQTGAAPLHFALIAAIGALLFGPDALLSGAAAQDAGGARDAATAVGVVNGMGSAGALLQGVLTIGVQQAFDWNALFYVFVGLSLLAALCLLPALRAR
jgi:sugar phosphate permease